MSVRFVVGDFCQRYHITARKGTAFSGTERHLVELVEANWERRIPGTRDGVVLVPVCPDNFLAGVRILVEGDSFECKFEARDPKEEPRKSTYGTFPKNPAKSVSVVCYSWETLAEDDEELKAGEKTFDYEIVTLLGSEEEEDWNPPMGPETLMANHFHISGGTATRMTPEEFERELRRSFLHWRNRVIIAG